MEQLEKEVDKGIKKSVTKAHIRHSHYKETRENVSTLRVTHNVIKSKKHTIANRF